MSNKNSESHEIQWRKLRKMFSELSKEKDDIYNYRSQACARLLTKYCQT